MTSKPKKLNFEYPEDELFFIFLLGKDGVIADRFNIVDSPREKRRVFDGLKNHTKKLFFSQGRTKCELRLPALCDNENLTLDQIELDHIIPLSSNEINKRVRKISSEIGKKIRTQSFGSNHTSNLLVACRKCNAHKKHRFVKRYGDRWVIVSKNDPIWELAARGATP